MLFNYCEDVRISFTCLLSMMECSCTDFTDVSLASSLITALYLKRILPEARKTLVHPLLVSFIPAVDSLYNG